MISEEVAGVISACAIGVGYTIKHLLGKFDGGEERRGSAAVMRSMRGEIDRLSALVGDLSDKLDEEIARRQGVETALARARGRIEALEEHLRDLGGKI